MEEKKKRRTPRGGAESRLGGMEVREPIVDVFEEAGHMLVLAELPGIGKRHVKIEFEDDVLTISAERGAKKYRKEVLLPRNLSKERMKIACRNGILEIKCLK
jgi:HSP20 family protein